MLCVVGFQARSDEASGPMASAEIRRFNHPKGWRLAEEPVIDPEHASLYVQRLLEAAVRDRTP